MQQHHLPIALALVLSFAPAASLAESEADVDAFREKIGKWVETRQILSEEKADWLVEKDVLRATRDLLRDQKKALEAEVAELTESNSAADDERRELLLERGEHQRAARALEERIRKLEKRVLELSKRLPAPLQKTLEPLLVQIPTDDGPVRARLGQRLMSVLGVLAQAQKWNGTATFVGETREVGGSERVQVRTLYWGLGQAVFVDARGQVAGVGKPGAEGWEFVDDDEIVAEAELLLDIYEGNVDVIDFVEIPVAIQ